MKSYFVSHCSRCLAYRVKKIDEHPYPCKHIHSYLTRTYILVRKRNSEKNKNEKEEGRKRKRIILRKGPLPNPPHPQIG